MLILPCSCYTFPCKLVTNLLLDQDHFYLRGWSNLNTYLLDSVWIL